MVMETTSEIMK